VPYLHADPARIEAWRERIGTATPSHRRVGLVWGGNAIPDARRSATLADFAPLAEVSDVTFFSLQKGAHAEQLKHAPAGLRIVDLAPELNDFSDTAAALANLDLLITIDTAAAHLSGALARPTWVLLPHVPDWRWLAGTDERTGWYPTARTFRQPAPGDWNSVIERVKRALIGAHD
jgi:ADP-heptose:LPS heptosyltransferase